MNNRTLLLGCSHTAGSYTPDDKVDRLNHGYATLLACKFNCDWKMYSFPGDGIVAYATTLKHLDQENKLDSFDNIVIQLTSEPRFNLYENWAGAMDFITATIDSPNPSNKTHIIWQGSRGETKFSLIGRMFYELYESFFENEKSEWIDVVNDVTQTEQKLRPNNGKQLSSLYTSIYYQYIKDLCNKHDINLYTFGWDSFAPSDLPEYEHIEDDNYIFKHGELMSDILTGKHSVKFLKENITETGCHAFSILAPIISEIVYSHLIAAGYPNS